MYKFEEFKPLDIKLVVEEIRQITIDVPFAVVGVSITPREEGQRHMRAEFTVPIPLSWLTRPVKEIETDCLDLVNRMIDKDVMRDWLRQMT